MKNFMLKNPTIWECPWWLSGKESTYQCRRQGCDPWVGTTLHVTEQGNLCATAAGLSSLRATTLKPCAQSPCSTMREATATRSPRAARGRSPSREKPTQQQTPSTANNINKLFFLIPQSGWNNHFLRHIQITQRKTNRQKTVTQIVLHLF